MPELAFIKKRARGKNRANLRSGNSAGQPFNSGSVVHHRRNTPAGNRPEDNRGADTGVREHQADLFALLAVLFEDTRHKQRFGQQFTVAVRLEIDIFHARFFFAVTVHRRQQRFIQRFTRAHRHAGFHHNLVQHFTGNTAAVASARRFRHRQRSWRQQVQLNAREKAAFH